MARFREDLYYRLNVFAIFIPPLRERKPDLLLLADHFLEKASLAHGKHIKRISTPAIDMLMAYHWPATFASSRTPSSARSSCATDRSFTPTICRPRCRPRPPLAR